MTGFKQYLAGGITFVFKRDGDIAELLEIFARHCCMPHVAIDAFFSGSTSYNNCQKRFETYCAKQACYWLWLEEKKKVIIIDAIDFGVDYDLLDRKRLVEDGGDYEPSPVERPLIEVAIDSACHESDLLASCGRHIGSGRAEKALALLGEVLRAHGDANPLHLIWRASAYLHRGEFEKAIVDLDKALVSGLRYARPLFLRGQAMFRLGNFEAALVDLNSAIETKPFEDELSRLFRERGRLKLAMADEQKAKIDFASSDYIESVKRNRLRAQVKELIVRQAIKGQPWKDTCEAGLVNCSISVSEIEDELTRRAS